LVSLIGTQIRDRSKIQDSEQGIMTTQLIGKFKWIITKRWSGWCGVQSVKNNSFQPHNLTLDGAELYILYHTNFSYQGSVTRADRSG
jgi:hypothetical protein